MSIFASLGIIILATLIQCFMQLRPGIFSLFRHYASGKLSKNKANNLCIQFILGSFLFSIFIFSALHIAMVAIASSQISHIDNILNWIMGGIFLALSLASCLFYFRKSPGTEIFISRGLANRLNCRAKTTKTNIDSLALGFFSGAPELPFTLPLYLISLLEIEHLSAGPAYLMLDLLLYAFIIIIPLLIIYGLFKFDHNLADITKRRVKNKPFFRIIVSLSYLSLAIIIICFRILT